MPKFKLGDKVKCIGDEKKQVEREHYGFGWIKDSVFTITGISETYHDDDFTIYWKGLNNGGVFEFGLELVNMTQHQKLKSKMTGDSIS